MTRVPVLLVAGAMLSIVLLPGRAAAQGLPRPTLRADFGAPTIQIVTPARVIGHRPMPATHVASTLRHVSASGPFVQHQTVPAVDCKPAPKTNVQMGHRPAGSASLIHIVPVAPCPPRR